MIRATEGNIFWSFTVPPRKDGALLKCCAAWGLKINPINHLVSSPMTDRESLDAEWLQVSRELWDERVGMPRYWELHERLGNIEAEMAAIDRYEMLKAFAP